METRDDSKALRAFRSLWGELFRTSVHLDSALSKQPSELKSDLAQAAQMLLRRPVSESRARGLQVGEGGAPWSLGPADLAVWGPAAQFYRAGFGAGVERLTKSARPVEEDFPGWLREEWARDWGSAVSRDLVQALGEDPPLSLRASRRTGAEALIRKLSSALPEGVSAVPSKVGPFGVRISGYAPVLNTDAYREGLFEIQDEGSQAMALFALWPEIFAPLLSPEPGSPAARSFKSPEWEQLMSSQTPSWTVVDACAGAGGKTLAIADALNGRGRVFAYDTSQGKITALKKRASRAGLRNVQGVTVRENHEEEVVKRFRRRADVVLVDAPCSGWGVLRRNPDIKWRRDDESLGRMPGLQRRILSAYSDLVAPGGSLVFGVCTFRKAETLDVVRWFSERHPDFTAMEGGYLGPGGTDGFFMQRFKREGARG